MDVKKIRKDFPILERKVNGKLLAYLDNAAMSQKPRQVIEAIADYYRKHNANVHRGIHTLSVEATEMLEAARAKVGKFVGVGDVREIIFVRNATEAINLVAYAWGRLNIGCGDEIVLTVAEHHSNFVVWQQLALENGAVLKIVPIRQAQGHRPVDDSGQLDLTAFGKALTKKTKLVTFFHVSNVLGTINDVRKLVEIINKRYVALRLRSGQSRPLVLIDGAQAVPHMPVDIPKMGCDFYVFTGHKMLGPTGIGVLWGRRRLLEAMPPFLFGGEMISKVSFEKTTWNDLPWKFEAGTPNIAGAIGLGAAVDYLENIGMENVRKHEMELTEYAIGRLSEIPGVTIYGPRFDKKDLAYSSSRRREVTLRTNNSLSGKFSQTSSVRTINRAGVVSFNVGSPSTRFARSGLRLRGRSDSRRSTIHAHDVASILDSEGIAIRSGHHCAQPLMDFLGITSAARASFYLYNTKEEVDRLVEGILKVKKTFRMSK